MSENYAKIFVRSKCRLILWNLKNCRFLLAAPSTLLTHSMAVTTRTCLFRSPLGHEKRFIWIYEDIKAISLAAAFDGLFSNVCYQYLSIFVRFCQYVLCSLTVKLPLGNLQQGNGQPAISRGLYYIIFPPSECWPFPYSGILHRFALANTCVDISV